MIGFLNINKPRGLTAHDVVARVRRTLKMKQVGHGGTLDPAAFGVLPIAVGKATRLLRFLDGTKTYVAEILLGKQTSTDDLEGDTIGGDTSLVPSITMEAIAAELDKFLGTIEQLPPMYSAVHLDGKRMYAMARAGTLPAATEIPLRTVTVHRIELLSYDAPVIRVRIKCGAGTYIRSIARDLGNSLGCGGTLQSLLREEAGPFHVEQAVPLEELSLSTPLLPPQSALVLPRLALTSETLFRLTRGQSFEVATAEVPTAQEYVLAMHNDILIAVCKILRPDSDSDSASVRIQPEVVLENAQQSK